MYILFSLIIRFALYLQEVPSFALSPARDWLCKGTANYPIRKKTDVFFSVSLSMSLCPARSGLFHPSRPYLFW